MILLIILIALASGTVSGTLAGGLLSWWLLRKHSGAAPAEPIVVDSDTEHRIKQAASEWARRYGRPVAAELVADKLRLLYMLNERASRRLRQRGL